MTPLIREMVAFTGSIDDSPLKPDEMMWFDAGMNPLLHNARGEGREV